MKQLSQLHQRKWKISVEKHSQEGSFVKVQLSANKQRSDGEEVTICKDLGQKRAKIEPVQVTSCDLCLPADNNQGALQARCSLDPANHESEKFGHPYRSIKPHKRPNVSDCERDTMSTSKESKMFSSSTEAKPVSFSRLFYDKSLFTSRPRLVMVASGDEMKLRSHLTS